MPKSDVRTMEVMRHDARRRREFVNDSLPTSVSAEPSVGAGATASAPNACRSLTSVERRRQGRALTDRQDSSRAHHRVQAVATAYRSGLMDSAP